MPNPYLHWDVAANHQLHVTASQGPLIVDDTRNTELLSALVGMHCQEALGSDLEIGYFRTLEVVDSAQPNTGIKISQYQCMPFSLEFNAGDPVNSEPRLHDYCDAYGPLALSVPYVSMGYRASFRGWVATPNESNLQCNIAVRWQDAAGARLASASRGGFTGHTLIAYNLKNDQADYVFGIAHGKRPTTDSNWVNSAVVISPLSVTAPGSPITRNNVSWDKLRITCAGGSPSWNIQYEQDQLDTDVWTTLFNTVADLTSELVPGEKNRMALTANLFAGSGLLRNYTDPPLEAATYFNYIEVSQFEPWVIDKASWSYLDWSRHMAFITGGYNPYNNERRIQQNDLRHIPLGEDGSPTTLRTSDSELGICIEFNSQTYLQTQAAWDLAGMYIPANFSPAAVCDVDRFGADAPVTMVGKFKFQNMSGWSVPVDIMGAGDWRSIVPAANNGMGLYWNPTGDPGDGELVARAWDSVSASWIETSTPFNLDDYQGNPVELSLIWTGVKGPESNRVQYSLYIAINAATKSTVVIGPGFTLTNSEYFIIGSKAGLAGSAARSFDGLFREGVVFADVLSDEALLNAFSFTDTGVANPSFETQGDPNRPGEALSWTWESSQQVGGWADFNAYDSRLREWATVTEEFIAGFYFPHDWQYEDATARLAASGFVTDDIGKSAYQSSDDSMWILTSIGPIAWLELDIPSNEEWADDLSELTIAAKLFNEGVGIFESIQEIFALWQWGAYKGAPWLDSYTFTSPATDNPITGWTGYAFPALSALGDFPLYIDQFNEAWGTDPYTSSYAWSAAPAQNGRFKSDPISFPVDILPSQNQLLVKWTQDSADDEIRILELTPGTYADATAMAAMMDTIWQSTMPASNNMGIVPYDSDSGTGIMFQWDGTVTTIRGAAFGSIERAKHNDVRSTIGLSSISASTCPSSVRFPAEEFSANLPLGAEADDVFLIDSWSQFIFVSDTDPNIAGAFVKDYNFQGALFDSSTVFELFTLVGWIGPGAIWKSSYSPGDLVAALFDSGTNAVEEFDNTEWPDEPF